MINGVHHVSIATVDLDRALAFYSGLLGLPVGSTIEIEDSEVFSAVVGLPGARVRGAWLRAANLHIEIFQYLEPTPAPAGPRPACDAGIRHICFDVTDIHAEHQRLVEAGIAFVSEPQLFKSDVWSAYAYDPDGNIVELQEILEDSLVARAVLPA